MFGAAARGASSGLPWLGSLAISASIAYGLTVTLTGALPSADAPIVSSAAQARLQGLVTAPPGESMTTPAASDGLDSREACDATGGRMLYVGLNSWIPAESRVAPCPDGGHDWRTAPGRTRR